MAKSNIFAIAKRIRKQNPKIKWATAVKQAGAQMRKVGSVKKPNRQTGSSNKKIDKQRTAKAPGKRKSATGKVYYERRKNRSDKPGSLAGIKQQVYNNLGSALMAYEKAGTIKATKAARVKITKYRKILKAL
jgi:hypothetical protein